MEAARHLDSGHGPSVRALDDRVEIERLTVADRRTAELVRARQEQGRAPEETVAEAIEIGARVLDRESTAVEVDYVRGEFERSAGQVGQLFTESSRTLLDRLEKGLERAFAEEEGALAKALESHSEELADELARAFGEDRSTAVQHRIREMVAKTLEESRNDLIRHLSSEDGQNPIADFKQAVVRQVSETRQAHERTAEALREQLGALREDVVRLTEQREAADRVAEAEEAGTRKGLAFEERVHEAIEAIASGRGDEALHVGGAAVTGGGKRGDTLVEVGAVDGPCTARIVFEAKDRRLGKREAWEELDEAMAQREADFAVLVVAGEDHVPAKTSELHEYEGNKLVVSVDPEDPAGISLEAAYRLARARVLLAQSRSLEVDAAGVRDAAEAAANALKQAQGIKRALTEATKSVDGARTGIDGMVAAVRAQLSRIEDLVEASEPADAG